MKGNTSYEPSMNLSSLTTFLLFFILSADSFAFFGRFRGRSYTLKTFDKSFVYQFADLPLQGDSGSEGYIWPGSYWPDFEGGIAKRWNTLDEEGFSYKLYKKSKLLEMSEVEISHLSPAEKYDIYRSQYSYPTVKSVWANAHPNEARWNGICHGVAVASLYHKEPMTKTLVNKDGISIRFYTSDIKAILALYYAKYAKGKVRHLGYRCNRESGNSRNCDDMKASDFHILLSNQIGLRNESFIADIDRYKEVWNQAASSYQSEIIDQEDNHIHIKTTVSFAGNADPYRTPVIGTDMAFYEQRTYEYVLILDETGKISKGEWLSLERPDFAWLKANSPFYGKWKSLSKLL